MSDDQPTVPQHPLQALATLPRWCRWSYQSNEQGRRTKRPHVSTLQPSHWRPHADLDESGDGDGFVLTGGVRYGGAAMLLALDLDAALLGGTPTPWAQRVLDLLPPTYVEVTPSCVGLRVWVAVRKLPPTNLLRSKVTPPDAEPIGGKNPEVQVFGLGPAGYVTVSWRSLHDTPREIAVAPDIDALIEHLHLREPDGPRRALDLPVGIGDPPRVPEVLDALRQAQPLLSTGNWQGRYKSASEGFAALAISALCAANGHAVVAVTALLQTAYGLGAVESAEPDRYTRRNWVEREITRLAKKAAGRLVPHDLFSPLPPNHTEAQGSAALPLRVNRWAPIREFLSGDLTTQFLVHGVLPRSGLAQVFGDPACGKTPVALSLALHVAAARNTWFEHDLDRSGPVAYLVGEDANGIRARMRAEGDALQLDTDALPIVVSRTSGALIDREDVDQWIREAREHHPEGYALVVIDTLARNFGDGDENSTPDIGKVVANAQHIADSLGCLVLLVHHTGHKEKERARGAMALLGALDASLRVVREGTDIVVETTKAKNWATPEPLKGRLVPREIGRDTKGRPVTAITLDTAPSEADGALDPAVEVAADPLLHDVLRAVQASGGEPLARRSLAESLSTSEHSARVALARLVELDLVSIERSEAARRPGIYALTQGGLDALDAASMFG